MLPEIKEIIHFQLTGKFAHFRKFYTNSSSLSYNIPPRTVITGILASILKIPRDEYYNMFSNENIRISVAIDQKAKIKKITQSINYLHFKYYNLLIGNKGKFQHSQCKFELLMGEKPNNITYDIYLALLKAETIYEKLKTCLINKNLGYGIYLGQRPFKAQIESVQFLSNNDYKFLPESNFLNSICVSDNVDKFDVTQNPEVSLLSDRMPCDFNALKKGREISSVKTVIHEQHGKRLKGNFKNVVKVNNRFISFF